MKNKYKTMPTLREYLGDSLPKIVEALANRARAYLAEVGEYRIRAAIDPLLDRPMEVDAVIKLNITLTQVVADIVVEQGKLRETLVSSRQT